MSRRLVEEIQAPGYFLAARRGASYDEGRALLARGDALAFLVIPRRLPARRRARPAAGAAPARRQRPAHGGARPRLHRPGRGGLRHRRADVPRDRGAPSARRAASMCASGSGSTRRCATATSSWRAGRHAADQSLPVGDQPRPGRRARERHLRADAVAADDAARDRPRQAAAVRRRQLPAAPFAMLGSGVVFGIWPQGSWLALGWSPCPSSWPRWPSACSCRRSRAPRRRPSSSPCSSSCRRSCCRA